MFLVRLCDSQCVSVRWQVFLLPPGAGQCQRPNPEPVRHLRRMQTESIERVLRHYPDHFRDFQVVSGNIAAGFSGAGIVRLRCGGRDYCLRRWPDVMPEPGRLAVLHRLLRHIFHAGVTEVPVPVAASAGSSLVCVGEQWWQLEPWMPGTADYAAQPNENRLRAAVRSLARWHHAARNFDSGAAGSAWFATLKGRPSPAVNERLGLLAWWSRFGLDAFVAGIDRGPDSELRDVSLRVGRSAARLAGDVADELRSVRTVQFEVQPCLRDVWHDHLLFTDNRVTGLIDASAARTESVAADLARLVGSLVGDDQSGWSVALDEYQRQRALSLDELALIPILDRSGVLLSGLSWLRRCYVDGQTLAPPARVQTRMSTIARRLESAVHGV